MTDFVSYLRVSTDKQGRSGLGLEAQREAIIRFIKLRCSGSMLAEFTEIESGRKNDRPALAEAIALCRKRKATLLIAQLDRLGRNMAFIANLMDSNVEFVAVDMPEANRFTMHILAAVAEHEREATSNRIKAALRVAKARGVKLGNPGAANVAPLAHKAHKEKADRFAGTVYAWISQWQRQGMSLSKIANELNNRNIPTARGGSWYSTTVRNIIARVNQSDSSLISI